MLVEPERCKESARFLLYVRFGCARYQGRARGGFNHPKRVGGGKGGETVLQRLLPIFTLIPVKSVIKVGIGWSLVSHITTPFRCLAKG